MSGTGGSGKSVILIIRFIVVTSDLFLASCRHVRIVTAQGSLASGEERKRWAGKRLQRLFQGGNPPPGSSLGGLRHAPCLIRRINARYLTPLTIDPNHSHPRSCLFLNFLNHNPYHNRFALRHSLDLLKSLMHNSAAPIEQTHAWRFSLFRASNGLLSMVVTTTSISHSNSTPTQS
jgi:hypothetical protein